MRTILICLTTILALTISGCSKSPAAPEPAGYADTIYFLDIPWGSSSQKVAQTIHNMTDGNIQTGENIYLPYPTGVFEHYPLVRDAGNMIAESDLKLFGYDAITSLFCVYYVRPDGSVDKSNNLFYLTRSQILADDLDAAYNDIASQLTALYGPGSEDRATGWSISIDDEDVTSFDRDVREIAWYGTNDTFAALKCSIPDNPKGFPILWLAYGTLAAENNLDAIAKANS